MTTQVEMFPKTKVDFATEFLEHFQADVESAEKSLLNAQAKLSAAVAIRNDAEENLRRERIAEGIATPEEIALDMKLRAEGGRYGLSFQVNDEEPIVIAEAPASSLQSFTEEVKAELDAHGVEYTACDPITGEVTSKAASPVVVAVYPDPDSPDGENPVATTIGDRTTYGELAADYMTWANLSGPLADLAVVDGDYEPRRLRDRIHPDDYGRRLHVVILADSSDLEQCTVCAGDGRAICKDGSHNGNKACENCGGYGCMTQAAVVK